MVDLRDIRDKPMRVSAAKSTDAQADKQQQDNRGDMTGRI